MLPMRLSSNIAAVADVAKAVSPRCKTCNRQYKTRLVSTQQIRCLTGADRRIRARRHEGRVERSNSGRQGVRACLR
eukprot:1068385-Pleurochrysis_carterae.AAC.1